MKTINVGQLLDEGRWTGYQKLLIAGTALAIILDGVDNQLLGPSIPALMAEWNLPRGAFATALATGPFGMLFGGAFGGMLGDRIGRRNALLLSVVVFAIVTLGVSFSSSVGMLAALRFLAGLGLGGAMPNAAALASEYVPKQKRAVAVTLTIVCVPLGGFLAAWMAGLVIPSYGWRTLFAVGGVLPVVLALTLYKILPESPRFLATRRERWPELIAVLRRIGHKVPSDAVFMETPAATAKPKAKASMKDIFVPGFRRDTFGLFGSFFFCLMANYIGILWIVTMLTGAGFPQPAAANVLAGFNLGGVAGALAAAFVIQRFGSRITMLGMCAAAIVCALIMTTMPLVPSLAITVMFALTGGLLNAVQTTMYALATNVYPTEIRGTGVGTAVAVGRIGHVLSSYVGAWALDSGTSTYFTSWAVTMALVFISLAVVKRHIERTPTGVASRKVSATAH